MKADPDRTLLLAVDAPDTHGFFSDELFNAASVRVWSLDPA